MKTFSLAASVCTVLACQCAVAIPTGTNGETVSRPQHNAEFFILRNVLIPGNGLFALQGVPSAPMGRSRGVAALLGARLWFQEILLIKRNGALNSHRRLIGEVGRNQGFQAFHFPQLALGNPFFLKGQPGALVGVDFPLLRGDPLPKLFQRVFSNHHGNVLELLQVGKVKPSLRGICSEFGALSSRGDATDKPVECSTRPDLEQVPMILNHKIKDLRHWHGIQSIVDDALQVSIHGFVEYAPDGQRPQELGRKIGTTTVHWYSEAGRLANGGFPQRIYA
jgi:hypothetical protein